MAIGSATGAAVTLPITMTSNEDVQGFVLAVSYDAAYVEATDVVAAGATTAAGAELVVPEILASGFTLGVVLDFNPPYGGQVIPQGIERLDRQRDHGGHGGRPLRRHAHRAGRIRTARDQLAYPL